MIVLTGDVHQWIESADRTYTDATECRLALEYARIAAHHGLKVTLFFTGRAIIEDPASVKALLREESVEFAGHGWDSFRPEWRYRTVNKIFGSPHGSRAMQARMVRRTCATIERAAGPRVLSWRNHAYRFDRHTPRVLADAGVLVWSDDVDPEQIRPYRDGSVTVLPINTTPDHEHVYHGEQTVERVSAAGRSDYDHPHAWVERISQQVESIVQPGGVATILAHPMCMKVADDWRTFERLCERLSHYPSAWAVEAAGATTRDAALTPSSRVRRGWS
jgi:hypothetical protein